MEKQPFSVIGKFDTFPQEKFDLTDVLPPTRFGVRLDRLERKSPRNVIFHYLSVR